MIPLYKVHEPQLAQALKDLLPLERRRERISDRVLANAQAALLIRLVQRYPDTVERLARI